MTHRDGKDAATGTHEDGPRTPRWGGIQDVQTRAGHHIEDVGRRPAPERRASYRDGVDERSRQACDDTGLFRDHDGRPEDAGGDPDSSCRQTSDGSYPTLPPPSEAARRSSARGTRTVSPRSSRSAVADDRDGCEDVLPAVGRLRLAARDERQSPQRRDRQRRIDRRREYSPLHHTDYRQTVGRIMSTSAVSARNSGHRRW